MRIIEEGHVYELAWLDGLPTNWDEPRHANQLIFVNREGNEGAGDHPGTQCQEVLRALIDRVQHCDERLHWEGNERIIACFREALVLFEARALVRKAQKGLYKPELVETGDDGHFQFRMAS